MHDSNSFLPPRQPHRIVLFAFAGLCLGHPVATQTAAAFCGGKIRGHSDFWV